MKRKHTIPKFMGIRKNSSKREVYNNKWQHKEKIKITNKQHNFNTSRNTERKTN